MMNIDINTEPPDQSDIDREKKKLFLFYTVIVSIWFALTVGVIYKGGELSFLVAFIFFLLALFYAGVEWVSYPYKKISPELCEDVAGWRKNSLLEPYIQKVIMQKREFVYEEYLALKDLHKFAVKQSQKAALYEKVN